MYLLNDANNDSVAAVVTEMEGGTENVTGVCSASAPNSTDYVTIRISDAEMEGVDRNNQCQTLEALDKGSTDLYYAGSDEVVGTYRFIADRPENEFRDAINDEYSSLSLFDGGVYDTSPTDADPYATTALFGVSVETTYQDDRITYTRNVTFPPTAR